MFATTLTWDWSLWFEIVTGSAVGFWIAKHLP